MNNPSVRLICAFLAALLLGVAIPQLAAVGPLDPPASQPPAQTLPQVGERYFVLDTSRVPAQQGNTVVTLEGVLNDLGAQGWQVRASIGSVIILAR